MNTKIHISELSIKKRSINLASTLPCVQVACIHGLCFCVDGFNDVLMSCNWEIVNYYNLILNSMLERKRVVQHNWQSVNDRF